MQNVLGASLDKIVADLIAFIPNLFSAIIIFLATLYISRLGVRVLQTALNKRHVDPEVKLLLLLMARWSIIIFGMIWALSQVNFNVTSFVAGLGIIGFTVGFALKDIAENFVAGILLLLQQPFDIGDAVEVAGYGGTVTSIEIRSTTIRTWDGLLVIIPNADVYGNAITNYSKVNKRRINVSVGVGYETDLEKADVLIRQVIDVLPGIKDDPAPQVVFDAFGDSAINATVYFWIDTGEAGYFASLDAVVKGIKRTFEAESVNIPFPIRTIYNNQVPTK
jgi:small-conductance mechanosensitive channel